MLSVPAACCAAHAPQVHIHSMTATDDSAWWMYIYKVTMRESPCMQQCHCSAATGYRNSEHNHRLQLTKPTTGS